MPKLIILALLASLFITLASAQAAPPAEPLPQAHSHNDYQHERPLHDALDCGFCNIEADVFLVGDQLLVGHMVWELRPERTLEALYLDPLQQLVADREGKLYPDGQRLTLLIDFKTDGPATYAALAKLLKRYEKILSGRREGKWQPRQIDVIISGNRPVDLIANDEQRLVAIDGRLGDLEGDSPADLIPLVSDSWSSHFKWRGQGAIPAAERTKLHALADKAHAKGRRLRFWATPDSPQFWQELQTAGVDVIGADDLKLLHSHLAQ